MENITEYLKQAFNYKNEGNYKEALDFFYKALAIENESSEILFELAQIYNHLGKPERSLELYEQVLSKDNENNEAKFEYAKLLAKSKKQTKAKNIFMQLYENQYKKSETIKELFSLLLEAKDYNEIIKIFKHTDEKEKNADILYYAGIAYAENGNKELSQECYKKAIETENGNIDAGYKLALSEFENGYFEECEKLIIQLLKRNEDDRLFYLSAEINCINKNYDEAMKNYSYAIRINENDPVYYYKLGLVLTLKGYFNEAEQSYYTALEKDSGNILYNYTLAYLYYTEKKYKSAEQITDKILILDEQNVNAISLKILLAVQRDDMICAKKYIDKLTDLKAEDDLGFYAQAIYYSKLNMWNKSLEAGKKAMELNSESLEYKYFLANSYFEANENEKSLKLCEEIITKNDKYINAYILSAKNHIKKNDYYNAKLNIAKAIELDLNNAEVHYLQGLINFNEKNYEKAAQCYKTAITINPLNIEYYEKTADSYYALGEYNDAYNYYKEASQLEIGNAKYRYCMAKCAIAMNDKESALTNFSIMKRLSPENEEFIKEYKNYLKEIKNKK